MNTMSKKTLAIVVCAMVSATLFGSGAQATTITFTENGMTYSGTDWINGIPYDEFLAQGISDVIDVFQYGSSLDPFDGVGLTCLYHHGYGIIRFAAPTNAVTVDWWASDSVYVEVSDASHNVLDTFSYSPGSYTFGTDTLTGAGISQVAFLFGDDPLLSGISTLTFEPVPEPGTMLLLGAGMAVAGIFRKKKHA